MKKIYKANAAVSPHALFLIRICFLVTLVELALILAEVYSGNYQNHIYATRLLGKMLEYVMLDITLAVIGSFLFDLSVRNAD